MSRAAAEEVFAGVRDKVNRMGGVGAWRERERGKREWRGWGDEEEKEEGKGGGGDEGEGEKAAEEREMAREKREQYEGEVSEYDAREEGGQKQDPLFEEGKDDDVSEVL